MIMMISVMSMNYHLMNFKKGEVILSEKEIDIESIIPKKSKTFEIQGVKYKLMQSQYVKTRIVRSGIGSEKGIIHLDTEFMKPSAFSRVIISRINKYIEENLLDKDGVEVGIIDINGISDEKPEYSVYVILGEKQSLNELKAIARFGDEHEDFHSAVFNDLTLYLDEYVEKNICIEKRR